MNTSRHDTWHYLLLRNIVPLNFALFLTLVGTSLIIIEISYLPHPKIWNITILTILCIIFLSNMLFLPFYLKHKWQLYGNKEYLIDDESKLSNNGIGFADEREYNMMLRAKSYTFNLLWPLVMSIAILESTIVGPLLKISSSHFIYSGYFALSMGLIILISHLEMLLKFRKLLGN